MQDFTTQTISAVLQAAGIKSTSEVLEDNTPVVIGDAFGVRIYFFPGSCASVLLRGCTDVYMISVITAPQVGVERLAKFNDEGFYAFVSSDAEGYTIARYDFEQDGQSAVNFIGGITMLRRDVLFFLKEFGFSPSTISELTDKEKELMAGLRSNTVDVPDLDAVAETSDGSVKRNELDRLLELVRKKDAALGSGE